MSEGTRDEERLTSYLLGQMRPDEQAVLEGQYLADPDLHDALRAAERDLIDRYVRGELANPTAFEQHFLSSARRRERVEFARALMRSLEHSPVVTETARSRPVGDSWVVSAARLFSLSPRAWQAALAALVILTGASLLIWNQRNQGLQNQASQVAREEQPTPGRPEPQAVPRPLLPAPESAAPTPTPLATFVLMPTLTRNSDDVRTLPLAGNGNVSLQLNLEANVYSRYRAVMRTVEGLEIWRQDQLQPVRTAGGEAVVLTLPISRLDDQDYTIQLGGLTVGGAEEDVSGYYFRVQKR